MTLRYVDERRRRSRGASAHRPRPQRRRRLPDQRRRRRRNRRTGLSEDHAQPRRRRPRTATSPSLVGARTTVAPASRSRSDRAAGRVAVVVVLPHRHQRQPRAERGQPRRVLVAAAVVRHLQHVDPQPGQRRGQRCLRLRLDVPGQQDRAPRDLRPAAPGWRCWPASPRSRRAGGPGRADHLPGQRPRAVPDLAVRRHPHRHAGRPPPTGPPARRPRPGPRSAGDVHLADGPVRRARRAARRRGRRGSG